MTICKITEYLSNTVDMFLDMLEKLFLEINYKVL